MTDDEHEAFLRALTRERFTHLPQGKPYSQRLLEAAATEEHNRDADVIPLPMRKAV